MYKITEERVVDSLPTNMSEENHVVIYLLDNSSDPENQKNVIKVNYPISRVGSTAAVIFNINDTEVWCKQQEFKYWQEHLPKVNNSMLTAWYVSGTTKENVDGYELYLMYKSI